MNLCNGYNGFESWNEFKEDDRLRSETSIRVDIET